MAQRYKSPTELFKDSRDAVKRNLSLFIFLNALNILNVAWMIGTDLRDHVHGKNWGSFIGSSLFGASSSYPRIGAGIVIVILAVIAVAIALMSVILVVKAAHGRIVTFDRVWETFKDRWFRLILVEVLLGFIIILGLLALIVPGVYLLGRLALAPYVLVEENTRVFEALERSWALTANRMWPVYNVLLFGILLALPNIIPIIGPIIALVLTIAYSVAMPMRYLELKRSA